jgi:site-specific DNA-cytosine methylase
MRILVACEESQAVTIELRRLGHEAYSCDILPCSGGHPEWHLQQDVLPLLIDRWDMIIAFPPCTHLSSAGACYWTEKQKDGRQQAAIDFFMKFIRAQCQRIAVENPVGWMNRNYRKPDQIIQPWMFGDEASKRTCLWLKGLPLLKPTQIVGKGDFYRIKTPAKNGATYSVPLWYQKLSGLSNAERAKHRSKTFPGIARAMAEQWAGPVVDGIAGTETLKKIQEIVNA